MSMQENVDIVRDALWGRMLQAEFQAAPLEVENQWPIEITVAIAAHDFDRRPERAQRVEHVFCADVTQMPDFIGVDGELRHSRRQPIVRIG